MKFITNPSLSITVILVTISFMSIGFTIPFIPAHFHSFGIKDEKVGFFFMVPCFAYMLAAMIFDKLPKYVNNKVWLLIGSFINIIGLLLMGPEPLLCLPRSLITATIGFFFMGTGIGILLIPAIPELIEIGVTQIYTDEKDKEKVSDMSSGFFNFAINFSGILSPNLGGALVG